MARIFQDGFETLHTINNTSTTLGQWAFSVNDPAYQGSNWDCNMLTTAKNHTDTVAGLYVWSGHVSNNSGTARAITLSSSFNAATGELYGRIPFNVVTNQRGWVSSLWQYGRGQIFLTSGGTDVILIEFWNATLSGSMLQNIYVKSGGSWSLIASGTNVPQVGTGWKWFEFYLKMGSTNGEFKTWWNDTVDIDVSSIDTTDSGTYSTIDGMRIYTSGYSYGNTSTKVRLNWQFDDIAINSVTGSGQNEGRCGPYNYISILKPTGDKGAGYNDMDSSGSAYTKVDEFPPNANYSDPTELISSDIAGEKQAFITTDTLSASATYINCVAVRSSTKRDGLNEPTKLKGLYLPSAGGEAIGTTEDISTSAGETISFFGPHYNTGSGAVRFTKSELDNTANAFGGESVT